MARSPQFLDEAGRTFTNVGIPALESAAQIWQGAPIKVVAWPGPGETGQVFTPFPTVALCISGNGHNDVWMERKVTRLPFRAGVLVAQGAGSGVDRCAWSGSADEIVSVQFPPDALFEFMPEAGESLDLETLMPFEDETLSALIMAMRNELLRNCMTGRMFAQSLSMALVSYLKSRYAGSVQVHRPHGKLSSREMARILDYVTQNLGQDIGIDDLAALVNLSSAQFTRRFGATVGMSPYRFLQQKRVERAVELMHGRQSLAEIAQDVGFTGQSHFTQVFRQILGTTPARARKAMRQ